MTQYSNGRKFSRGGGGGGRGGNLHMSRYGDVPLFWVLFWGLLPDFWLSFLAIPGFLGIIFW